MGPVGASSFARTFDTSAPKRDHQQDIPSDFHACEEPMAQPLSDAEIAEVRRLHGEGRSANAIARELGRSPMTITRVCRRIGLSFDRSKTAAAVKAQAVDMAARRAVLAQNLLDDAERLRAQMWEPGVVYAFGGKDNDYNEHPVAEPPAGDKRTLMQAATTALTAHLRLVDHDSDGGIAEAKSVLDGFMTAVAQRAAELGATDQ